MLYLIELEPIEKRYTKQWSEWFRDHCIKNSIDYHIITGTQREFKKGEFLDINRTNIFKAEQIIELAKLFDEDKIKEGDTFLIYDGWHYITTALRYMADLQDIKIKVISYWHAGSYDPNDFLGQKKVDKWAFDLENSWFKSADKILVATNFHRNLILEHRNTGNPKKIKVVGFPFDTAMLNNVGISKKENIIVFPHRVAPEKQPHLFDELKEKFPEYEFIKTIEVTKTKEEYYDILRRAKIVWSGNLQETFGIGTMEATMLGCIPLVPFRLCYSEMYHRDFLYAAENEMEHKVKYFMNNYDNLIRSSEYIQTKEILKSYTNINNMFKEIINEE